MQEKRINYSVASGKSKILHRKEFTDCFILQMKVLNYNKCK